VDGQSNLYIADASNNRVRFVHMTPSAKFSAGTLQMGTWPLNTPSTPKSVTIASNGDAEFVVTNLTITGTNAADFTQTNTCGALPINLGPYMQCAVSVTFTPHGYGRRTALLTFVDNAPNSPQKITLVGSGPDFTISANPNSLTVLHGNSASSIITLTPVGGFNQSIALHCAGAPASSTCSFTPNSVTLDGTHSGTATMNLQTTASTAPGTYTVTADGVSNGLTRGAPISVTVQ
jgi:hypothetical protein